MGSPEGLAFRMVEVEDDLVEAKLDLVEVGDDLVEAKLDLVEVEDDLVEAKLDLVEVGDDFVEARLDLVEVGDDLVGAFVEMERFPCFRRSPLHYQLSLRTNIDATRNLFSTSTSGMWW